MRVPLAWLRDYVDVPFSAAELADRLTLRGMEVTAIETSGADWRGVVVGRLLSVERHPNADKLWVTRVEVGGEAPLEIVCGADNIAPGQLVPVALPGAVLPGERQIGRTKIRGVVSNGMLCSPAELGTADDAEGIQILGTGDEHPIGAPLTEVLGDVVLDVDVKPNRGDALSMVGLAREIAAITGGELHRPTIELTEDPGLRAEDRVKVTIEDAADCPRFTARWFQDVRNGASPAWMQQRLVAAGMRPISAVVDVTNYVMHELGQPMHAYDADGLPAGDIRVRRARDGEQLTTIDHVERRLDMGMLVIADASAPIGLAGIMGGAGTEVTEATTRVVLESAIFRGPLIRNAARRLGLRSEASLRHEKGISHDLPRLAADRAAGLLAEITGARVASGIVDNDPGPHPQVTVAVDLDRLQRLIGIPVDAAQAADLLRPLEFEIDDPGGERATEITVRVPAHRQDVTGAEDVAEEVVRSYGYDRIPGRLPDAELPPYRPDPSEPRHRVRRILAGLGLDEVVTHALIGTDDLIRSGYGGGGEHEVRVANPVAEQHAILRPLLYPSLLAALAENVRLRRLDPWLFEVGKTYRDGGPGSLSNRGEMSAGTGRHESWTLGIALLGPRAPRTLHDPQREADVGDLRGVVDALHAALGAPLPAYRAEGEQERHAHLHPGRASRMVDGGGRSYGSLGEVHPEVVAAWGLVGRPVIAAIHLDRLLALVGGPTRAQDVPAVQPVDRDLAVVVAEEQPAGDLMRLVRASAGPLLVGLQLFDAYRGPQVGDGRVSYALALRFQPERDDREGLVERAMERVRATLREQLAAEIR